MILALDHLRPIGFSSATKPTVLSTLKDILPFQLKANISDLSTAISHFQWSSINTDSTETRRATGFGVGPTPFHPVHLRCHLHCRITWCRSPLLCRRQPTLSPLPATDQSTAALRLAECIERVEG